MSMSRRPVICGIDAGRGSVKLAIADVRGQVLARGVGPGVIHLASPGGDLLLRKAVTTAWRSAADSLGEKMDVIATGLGHIGVRVGSPEAEIALGVVTGVLRTRSAIAVSDAEAAYVGVFGARRPGAVLTVGSSASCYGEDDDGNSALAGGWGGMFGNDGGGLALGWAALQAASAMEDGAMPASPLYDEILAHVGAADMRGVERAMLAAGTSATEVAALAVTVLNLAPHDPAADQLVDRAADAACGVAEGVLRRLRLEAAHVAVVGSLGQSTMFRTRLRSRLIERRHLVLDHELDGEAESGGDVTVGERGALRLAQEMLDGRMISSAG